jgi:hypothetical protein
VSNRARTAWAALALAATAPATARPAAADTAVASPGPVIEEHAPPDGASKWARLCSLHHPLCLHVAPGETPRAALAVLDAADRAWATLTGALGLPPPEAATDSAWPVYVVPDDVSLSVAGGSTAALAGRDPVARFDRGQSFAVVDRDLAPGCALDLALARAVARGSLLREAPATDAGSATAEVETLALLATPCAEHDGDGVVFQAHPDRTPVDPSNAAFGRGAALFFGWIDRRFGGSPGLLVEGLWALAPTRVVAPWRWPRTPTGFDVLRVSLRDRLFAGSTFDDAIVRFAVDRASMTPAPHADWRVAWPEHPRRLLPATPVAPLGASYVTIDLGARPSGATLHLEADWEDYGRMRWTVVKRDATGRALGELPMGSVDKGTHASLTIEAFGAAADLLLVGVDLGDTEAAFEPTAGEWEPHGWMLTLEQP